MHCEVSYEREWMCNVAKLSFLGYNVNQGDSVMRNDKVKSKSTLPGIADNLAAVMSNVHMPHTLPGCVNTRTPGMMELVKLVKNIWNATGWRQTHFVITAFGY